MDDDHWWAAVYVMEAYEDTNFVGERAHALAFEYAEGMVKVWFELERLRRLPVNDPVRYDIKDPMEGRK